MNQLKSSILTAALALVTLTSANAASSLLDDSLLVYRVGTGTGSLVNTGNAAFLDEYSRTGALRQSIDLGIVASGTASSEGLITRSGDGRYIVATGYASTGPSSIASSTSASNARVIARIDSAGNVDSTTRLTNYTSGNNPRSAWSADGSSFYAVGGTGGIVYATLGATSGTGVTTTGTGLLSNMRQINVFNNQLYASASSTTFRLATTGGSPSSTTGQSLTNLPGWNTSGTSPYGFFLADLSSSVDGLDTAYVADDTSGATGGLLKYSFVSGTWTLSGQIGTGTDAYRGLAAEQLADGSINIFATRKGGTAAAGGGELVSITDTAGYNAAFSSSAPTLLATAAANTAFRGVSLSTVPEPSSAALLGFGTLALLGLRRLNRKS
ncbi:PEP-CTERM sorting domain-containing protein [bacterium]|nr:PEP-CTERM sorting domain-containing protein [bacterium]